MASPVTPIRQRTQYSCGAASLSMALKALGCTFCDEDKVNEVMGAAPMQGASWEQIAAAANHYGCRSTLVVPSTLAQVRAWTDAGKPVLIGWNPEDRPWSHASLVFDVTDTAVFVADPNCPDPLQTVREMPHADFYKKWSEEWNGYKVRRPAMMIDREVDAEGRQVMASQRKKAALLTKNPRAPQGKFTVDLSIGPNPDKGEKWPTERKYAVASDLAEAIKVFKAHTSQMMIDGMGNGNSLGGTVRDDKGQAVAKVSWNGRLWEVDPQGRSTLKELRLASHRLAVRWLAGKNSK